MPASRL